MKSHQRHRDEANARARAAQQEVAAMQRSLSWRLSAPVRWIGRVAIPVATIVRAAVLKVATACVRLIPERLRWPLKSAFFTVLKPLLKNSREYVEFQDAKRWRDRPAPPPALVIAPPHASLPEVVILMIDAERAFDKQDLQIAALAAEEGRGIVIAVNKWDLVADKQATRKELGRELERLLPQIKGVPMVPVSALRKTGLKALMKAVFEVYGVWNERISTSALNTWLREALERHPPPAVSGRRLKMRYMTQPNARPPTFVLFCSRPKAVNDAYKRYLINGLRETFALDGVPLRLTLRKGDNPYAAGS